MPVKTSAPHKMTGNRTTASTSKKNNKKKKKRPESFCHKLAPFVITAQQDSSPDSKTSDITTEQVNADTDQRWSTPSVSTPIATATVQPTEQAIPPSTQNSFSALSNDTDTSIEVDNDSTSTYKQQSDPSSDTPRTPPTPGTRRGFFLGSFCLTQQDENPTERVKNAHDGASNPTLWVMSSVEMDSTTQLPVEREQYQAFTTTVLCQILEHSRKLYSRSLMDRGANGGILGNDAKVMLVHSREVDVTGIDNHELTALKIVDGVGKVLTHKGCVILWLKQCAYYGRGRSMHSCVQVEAYGNKVYDKSIRAGGLQCIVSLEGYIIPLDIERGLPYLNMEPPTEQEIRDLPHCILTSGEAWNPKCLDFHLTSQEEWPSLLGDLKKELIKTPFDEFGNYRKRQVPNTPAPDDERVPDVKGIEERRLVNFQETMDSCGSREALRIAFHQASNLNYAYADDAAVAEDHMLCHESVRRSSRARKQVDYSEGTRRSKRGKPTNEPSPPAKPSPASTVTTPPDLLDVPNQDVDLLGILGATDVYEPSPLSQEQLKDAEDLHNACVPDPVTQVPPIQREAPVLPKLKKRGPAQPPRLVKGRTHQLPQAFTVFALLSYSQSEEDLRVHHSECGRCYGGQRDHQHH